MQEDDKKEEPQGDVDSSGFTSEGRISQVLSYRSLTLRVGRALIELADTGTISPKRRQALALALSEARG